MIKGSRRSSRFDPHGKTRSIYKGAKDADMEVSLLPSPFFIAEVQYLSGCNAGLFVSAD